MDEEVAHQIATLVAYRVATSALLKQVLAEVYVGQPEKLEALQTGFYDAFSEVRMPDVLGVDPEFIRQHILHELDGTFDAVRESLSPRRPGRPT